MLKAVTIFVCMQTITNTLLAVSFDTKPDIHLSIHIFRSNMKVLFILIRLQIQLTCKHSLGRVGTVKYRHCAGKVWLAVLSGPFAEKRSPLQYLYEMKRAKV